MRNVDFHDCDFTDGGGQDTEEAMELTKELAKRDKDMEKMKNLMQQQFTQQMQSQHAMQAQMTQTLQAMQMQQQVHAQQLTKQQVPQQLLQQQITQFP